MGITPKIEGAATDVSTKRWSRGTRILTKIVIALIIALVGNMVVGIWYDTPKMAKIRRENRAIEKEYQILQERIALAENTIADIKHRDLCSVSILSQCRRYTPTTTIRSMPHCKTTHTAN